MIRGTSHKIISLLSKIYTNLCLSNIDLIMGFHKLFYESHFYAENPGSILWHGIPAEKNPLDLWIYQEIIYEVKPDVIVECGTGQGGCALFLASQCDALGKGIVVTIDIKNNDVRPLHERIRYIT